MTALIVTDQLMMSDAWGVTALMSECMASLTWGVTCMEKKKSREGVWTERSEECVVRAALGRSYLLTSIHIV